MVPSLGVFITLMLLRFVVDLYIWHGLRLVIKKLTSGKRQIIAILYFVLTFSILAFFTALYFGVVQPNTAYGKMFFIVYYLLLFIKVAWTPFIAYTDIRIFIGWLFNKFQILNTKRKDDPMGNSENPQISRLKFLQYSGIGVGSIMLGAGVYGIAKGSHNYVVMKRNLLISNLPKAFHGFKIVQISDIHSGSFWHRQSVVNGIEMVIAQKPDLVFFTGDLVNQHSSEFDKWSSLFAQIQAPHGVFSILGNHDYGDYQTWPDNLQDLKAKGDKSHMTVLQKEDHKKMIEHHQKLGWNLLLNENRILDIGGKKLAIIGVENWSALTVFPRYGNLQKAYMGSEVADIKLLLSHDPTHWRAEVLSKFPDIAATFSGHTHGSQIGVDTQSLRWSPVKYIYNDWIDLYTEGNQFLYVNRGFGYIGFPGRIGVPAEITVFTLNAK